MVAIEKEGMRGISFFRKHSAHDVGLPMDGCVRMKTFPALVKLS